MKEFKVKHFETYNDQNKSSKLKIGRQKQYVYVL